MTAKTYWTGLVRFRRDRVGLERKYLGRGWIATFRPSRSEKHGLSGSEVSIRANSQVAAQKALNLILDSLTLLHAESVLIPFALLAECRSDPVGSDTLLYRTESFPGMSINLIPLSCAVAAAASQRAGDVHAISKYSLSLRLGTLGLSQLDPDEWQYIPIPPFPQTQVVSANALTLAYSAIEELGLEIRATPDTPSMVGSKWNYHVLLDLERRLTRRGIDLSETLNWNLRGPRTRIEAKRKILGIAKADWARAQVRDVRVYLPDAILYASWLRSKVSAHRLNTLSRSLSLYDVSNVQHLARRLILESVHKWRSWQ